MFILSLSITPLFFYLDYSWACSYDQLFAKETDIAATCIHSFQTLPITYFQ